MHDLVIICEKPATLQQAASGRQPLHAGCNFTQLL